MRWEDLFADLEARWESALRSEKQAELPEVIRAELAAVTVGARLTGSVGGPASLGVAGRTVSGVLGRTGKGWLAVQGADGVDTVVNTAAIEYIDRLGVAQAGADPVVSRLSFGHALRSIAKNRSAVRVVVGRTGEAAGGLEMTGTIDRVGADHVDLALHDIDQPRRASGLRGVRTVPMAAIALVAAG